MTYSMLTTEDNPFDPFTQFEDWYNFDRLQGYNSCSYLAKVVKTSNELSPVEQNEIVEQAIDEIVSLNVLGVYKKVTKEF